MHFDLQLDLTDTGKMYFRLSRRRLLSVAAGLVAAPAVRPTYGGAPTKDLTFFAIGDWGSPQSPAPGQKEVATAMAAAAHSSPPSFIVTLGDNFYEDGVSGVHDPQWQTAFESVYDAAGLQCPWYPVLGDHDHRGEPRAQVLYSQTSSRWSMPSEFYSRSEQLDDGSKVDFFFLDTTSLLSLHSILPWHRRAAEIQLEWLDEALKQSTANWKVAVGHHPVVSGGPHGSQLKNTLKPVFDNYRVRMYLCGHNHNMQHVTTKQTEYFTCGVGSSLGGMPFLAPNTVFNEKFSVGLLRVTMRSRSSLIEFIDMNNQVLHSASIGLGTD